MDKRIRGVEINTPHIKELAADLAVVSRSFFIDNTGCSEEQYDRLIAQFGTDHLINILYGILGGLINGEIKCPSRLRDLVIFNYRKRIIELNLYKYEKRNFVVSYAIGNA